MHVLWRLTSWNCGSKSIYFPYTAIFLSPQTDEKEQISTSGKKSLCNKPNCSSSCRLPKQQALNNPPRFTKRIRFTVFNFTFCVCVFGYCKCCMSFEINLFPCSLKVLFCVTLSVKHWELRTPGQRSSKRVCGADRTSFQAISALLWNNSTQIQFFPCNWYVLLREESNLKGQVVRNPINRNKFQT